MKTTKTQPAVGITVEQPTLEQLNTLKITTWPIWTKEPSTFDWHYDD